MVVSRNPALLVLLAEAIVLPLTADTDDVDTEDTMVDSILVVRYKNGR
jgi:hypothetical protein